MTELMAICVGFAVSAFFMAGFTAIFSFMAYSKVVGLENSTHQVQYVPVDEKGKTGKELDKEMAEAFGVAGDLEEEHY